MPIRINLLTEALAEEELRRRDPVKRTIYVGILLVALALAWYSSTWLEYKLTQNKLDQINKQIQSQSDEYNKVQTDLKLAGDKKRRLMALEQLSTNRFFQGNLLDALQRIYTPNVQLLRIKLAQSYETSQGTPAKTDASGRTTGSPAKSTEKITLTLDAKDSSPNPGDQVNHYKDAIAGSGYFRSNNVQTNNIRLSNLSPAQSSANGKPFVLFTLECRFPDKTR